MADQHRVSVLCVCLGNICRSPLAAAVLKKLVADNGLSHVIRIDSAGTAGYHVGARADPRSEAECRKNNVPLKHSARKLSKQDFHEFDYILGMDHENVSDIKSIQPKGSKARVDLFGNYGNVGVIEDPYYGGQEGFEIAFRQATDGSRALLEHLRKTHGL